MTSPDLGALVDVEHSRSLHEVSPASRTTATSTRAVTETGNTNAKSSMATTCWLAASAAANAPSVVAWRGYMPPSNFVF